MASTLCAGAKRVVTLLRTWVVGRDTLGVSLPSIAPRRPARCSASRHSPGSTAYGRCSSATGRARIASHCATCCLQRRAVQLGLRVLTLRFGKLGLTSALRAPFRGEVLVDQHDTAFLCEPTTQSSMGRSPVASSHGKREFRVSIRKHHRTIAPILALFNQTVDCLVFESLLLLCQQEPPLGERLSTVHPPQRRPRPGLAHEGRSECFDIQRFE